MDLESESAQLTDNNENFISQISTFESEETQQSETIENSQAQLNESNTMFSTLIENEVISKETYEQVEETNHCQPILTTSISRKRKLTSSGSESARKVVCLKNAGLPRYSNLDKDSKSKEKGIDMSFIKQSIVENEIFVVEYIEKMRIENGKEEYFIKWHGYSRNEMTWEPRENLNCNDLLKKFEAKSLSHI